MRPCIHPNPGMVYACPHCNHAPAQERESGETYARFDADKRYVCYKCHTAFDEPIERPARPPGRRPEVAGTIERLREQMGIEVQGDGR